MRYLFFCFIILCNPLLFGQQVDWDALIEDWRTAYQVPGMSVGIIHNGKIILSKGYGVAQAGTATPVDQHTIFSIASNTKAFIAAAIAILVEEGKLDWDDKVEKHVPYFKLYDPCVSEMMTVRDLLCHRSGLGTFSGDVIWYRSNRPAAEVVQRAAELPAKFEFRNGYGYSNLMFIAAGEVIQSVTGKSWDAYVSEKFLVPLGMSRTVTSTNALPSISNVATPHAWENKSNIPISWVNWDNMGAAGGIISSTHDMLAWMALQLEGGIMGNDTFFSREKQVTMWTPHNNFPVSERSRETFGRNFNGYGLGWGLNEYQGHFVASHTGGYDGMYSSVYLLPYQKTGVVVLTNAMQSIGPLLTFEIFDKLFGLPQKDWKERGLRQGRANDEDRERRIKERTDARKSGTSPTLSPAEISHVYRSPMYGDIEIRSHGGKLMIDFFTAPTLRAYLTHWQDDVYKLDWIEKQAWFSFGTVQILKDNKGAASGLLFDVPNDDIFFEEINAVRLKP